MRNRKVDRVVGISDRVELFVAVFDPEQNLGRVSSFGGGTFTA
jgi:hypothetical protein